MNINIGDTIEVFCPEITHKKHIEIVKDIDNEWVIFESNNGKIQAKYCTKIKNMSDINKVLEDIKRVSLLENKGIPERIIKFNEEFGEFTSEIVKLLGFTHKPYDEEHLIEEGADALQVLISIIFRISQEKNIDFQRFIDAMETKTAKWESKIPDYRCNLEINKAFPINRVLKEGTYFKLVK